MAETNLGGPSFEDVVERLARVRPVEISVAKAPIPDLAGHSIGRYKVLYILGRGAFGVVYKAHDEQLGRDVALKVPRPEVMFDDEKLRRFEREAATAATLEHPSIVPIYEADLVGPTPYIASAYCAGPDLGKWLAKHKTSIPIDQAARFVIKLSEAVHYAHRQGVLHRDLKPSNVLLEPCHDIGIGSDQLEHFEPKLTDFGLAKLLEGDQQETQSSLMLGTPQYMAPEQVDKRIGNVGVQTDVHALGTILYELLLGHPTFKDSSQVELLLAIREREATPPSRIRPSVTPTLEAICLKALEKNPDARYATALEFAEDLGRYLRGEPTIAKPLALPSRIAKWVRLNPWAASLLAVISVAVVALVLGVSWHNHRLSEQLAVSDQLRIESAENANRSLRARYVADMQLTQQALASGRFSEARSRLDKYQPGSDGAIVSDFAWHLLSDQLSKTLVDFEFHGSLKSLATSKVLKASVTGGEDGMLRFFDTTTGTQLATTKAHEGNVNAIVFVEDGTTLVSGGDDGMICVWNASSLHDRSEIKLIVSRKAHEDDLFCLAVAPNSRWIASGSADNSVRLWNFKNLKPAGDLLGHTNWVRTLDFSPDSTSLVSGSHDGTIRRWDLETKQEVGQLLGHDKYVLCLKHHPTEHWLISGGKDRTIRVWDLETGEQRQQITVFNGWVRSLSLSADGNRIAASADDPRIMIFQRGSEGQYTQAKVMFTDRVANLAISFANTDSQIVSVGSGGLSTWFTDCDLCGKKLHTSRGRPMQMVCPANESSLAFVSSFSALKVNLEADTIHEVRLQEEGKPGLEVAISSDGNLLAAYQNSESDNQLRVFVSDETGKNKRVLYSSSGEADGIGVSPSGRFVAAGTLDHQIRIWQAPDFKQEMMVRCPYECKFDGLLIDDTGEQLFLQSIYGHELTVLDVATSKPITTIQNIEGLLNRTIDGRLLAISRSDYTVTIYDTQLGQATQSLPSHTSQVIAACFSPTEPLVATITNDGEITLWALDTGEILIQFQTVFSNTISLGACLAFTSDGHALIAAGGVLSKAGRHSSELRFWRVP